MKAFANIFIANRIKFTYILFLSITLQSPTFATQDPDDLIWQDGTTHFKLSQIITRNLMQSSEKDLYLAVIKTNIWSELAKTLAKDTSLLATTPLGFAAQAHLVQLQSLEQLDELAIASHQESGLCGSIEAFPFGHRVYQLKDSKLTLPSFHSRARFEGLDSTLNSIDLSRMLSYIEDLEGFGSRFHSSPSGIAAAEAIFAWFEEIGSEMEQLEVELIQHAWSDQPSVIARIVGDKNPDDLVILGAHLDSIAPSRNNAPGADDNASGIASLLEILRIIASEGMRFEKTIELHAYGAEEVGLIGSRELASQYREQQRKLVGMMQIDMNQWGEDPKLGHVFLITNHTSTELRRRAQDWLKSYITDDFHVRALPSAATSDHKAWFDQGFPTLFAFENPLRYNPNIHTALDTSENFNNPQLAIRMTQLAMLYISYSAGLSHLVSDYEQQLNTIFAPPGNHDLNLALIPEGNDLVRLAVSAPNDTASLEICEVESRWDSGCKKERIAVTQSVTRMDRLIFAFDETWPRTNELRLRIEAYDHEGKRISQRQVIASFQ